MDLFDYKPQLEKHRGTDLPDSIRRGQRITGMTSRQKTLPVAPSIFEFRQHGESGAWVSELLPHTAQIVDDIAVVKTLHTEAINHDPGITFFQTGSQQPGRPSLGAWLSYGLGSESRDLPSFVVMVSIGRIKTNPQPIFSRLWGAGFLPSDHQGVKFRSVGDPVLYLSNPPGVDHRSRRRMLDGIGQLNRLRAEAYGDPEITTRISQYEMAYKMQLSVPELTDVSDEPDHIFELYGPDSRKPGTYAANCLMARRLSEAGVRFVQLYHRGWDQHDNLPAQIRGQCEDTDQASAALVTDLKQRGLLDETLVIWGASSDEPSIARASSPTTTTGATTTRAVSPCGWREAGSVPESPTARPTTSATTWRRTRSTSTISRPPSSTAWESTTPGSPSSSRDATTASPTSTATL